MDFFKNHLDEEVILNVWIPLTLISWPLWFMLLKPSILEAKKGTSGHLTQSQSLTLSRHLPQPWPPGLSLGSNEVQGDLGTIITSISMLRMCDLRHRKTNLSITQLVIDIARI